MQSCCKHNATIKLSYPTANSTFRRKLKCTRLVSMAMGVFTLTLRMFASIRYVFYTKSYTHLEFKRCQRKMTQTKTNMCAPPPKRRHWSGCSSWAFGCLNIRSQSLSTIGRTTLNLFKNWNQSIFAFHFQKRTCSCFMTIAAICVIERNILSIL